MEEIGKAGALECKENNLLIWFKMSDSILSERALREIYLKGFEICVKESDPKMIMTSYNIINGVRASENAELLEGILRDEWGFGGLRLCKTYLRNDIVVRINRTQSGLPA